MSGPLKLEVFESESEPSDSIVLTSASLEEARLAAFEKGYADGWEDAITSQKDTQEAIGADLARSLQAMSFTYHEAKAHVLKALHPLLTAMIETVLPDIAHATLVPSVVSTIDSLAENMASAPAKVRCHPSARPAIESLLSARTGPPFEVVEEPTLGEGQADIKFGDIEVQVDLDEAVASIAELVSNFFTPGPLEERHHG